MSRPRNEAPQAGGRRPDWRHAGDRQDGGQVGHGLVTDGHGRSRMQLSVAHWATAVVELGPADAYRLATGILEQLKAGGFLPPDAPDRS